MYDRPTVVALREKLAAIATTQPQLTRVDRHSALERLVCAVVDEFKVAGWPPERVIIAVKQIASDAGLHPSRGVLLVKAPLVEQDALIAHLVLWCIQHYYGVAPQEASSGLD